jgi:hypothetical protein
LIFETLVEFLFFISIYTLRRAEVKGFQTLRKKLMICVPKDPPPNFSFQLEVKLLESNLGPNSVNHSHCTSQPLSFGSSIDLLPIEG